MKKCISNAAIGIFTYLIALCLPSCIAIDSKYTLDEDSTFEERLDSLIGILTFDQSLMSWGQPASVFDGDEIFLATWGDEKSGKAIFPISRIWFSMPIESGWKLQLSFSKTTRKLLAWKHNKW